MRRSVTMRWVALVDSTAGPEACWPWRGAVSDQGYGKMHGTESRGHSVRATHVALELDGRPRPQGLKALHTCDNPPCVNPAHLYWGTQKRNLTDMAERGRGRKSSLMSAEQVAEARRLRAEGRTYAYIGTALGVGTSTVFRAVRGPFA